MATFVPAGAAPLRRCPVPPYADFSYADLFSLRGQVVLLTGGYGYLGQAVARGLAAHGATVVVLGRDQAAFQAALGAEANVHFQPCDVADTASVQAALAAVEAQFGLPAVLINNAFYSRGSRPDQLTDEEFCRTCCCAPSTRYRSTSRRCARN